MTALVVGVDPSVRCTGIVDRNGKVGTLKPKNMVGAQRMAHLCGAVMDVCIGDNLPDPELVVIEGAAYGGYDRDGELAGLRWVLRVALWRFQVPVLMVPPLTLKKFATGSGAADKFQMVKAATDRLGYEGASPDEADALWLWALGHQMVNDPIVKLPKVNLTALDKLSIGT